VSGKTLLVLLVAVLIALAPYTFLPGMVESAISNTLQDRVGLANPPEVELGSSPPLMMYAGSFSEARISVKGYELGGIPTKYVALELDPFNLNLLESVTNRTVSTAEPLSGRLQIKLNKATSLRLSQAGLSPPPQNVELSHDQITSILSGQAPMGAPVS
jgi:LmeA-like phospholipid-binding